MAKKRWIVGLPRLGQFGIDREGLVCSPKADIALQGEAEEFFGRRRVWRKTSIERCNFGVLTCLEKSGGLRLNWRRCPCGGRKDWRSDKKHNQLDNHNRDGSQIKESGAQQTAVRSLEPSYHVAGMRTVAARYIRLT